MLRINPLQNGPSSPSISAFQLFLLNPKFTIPSKKHKDILCVVKIILDVIKQKLSLHKQQNFLYLITTQKYFLSIFAFYLCFWVAVVTIYTLCFCCKSVM